jgi:hypothetical protein
LGACAGFVRGDQSLKARTGTLPDKTWSCGPAASVAALGTRSFLPTCKFPPGNVSEKRNFILVSQSERMKSSAAYFPKFIVRYGSKSILTYEYLPRCFSPFCYGGDNEIYKHTAFQPRISGSKNASAPEAEGDTNARRSHWADRCLLGTGVLLGRSLEPDGKSFPDARSPLRVQGLCRATGSLTESDFISKLEKSQSR